MRAEVQIAAYEARITSPGRTISAQNSALDGPGAKILVIEGEFPDGWQSMIEACHREFESGDRTRNRRPTLVHEDSPST